MRRVVSDNLEGVRSALAFVSRMEAERKADRAETRTDSRVSAAQAAEFALHFTSARKRAKWCAEYVKVHGQGRSREIAAAFERPYLRTLLLTVADAALTGGR